MNKKFFDYILLKNKLTSISSMQKNITSIFDQQIQHNAG
jgi:hypothetical protein